MSIKDESVFALKSFIHHTYETTIIGCDHVYTTTLRNGGGKSKDSARRSIVFMAVHRRTAFSSDYLQVFELSTESGGLRIIHTLECPDYRKEYLLLSDVPITLQQSST